MLARADLRVVGSHLEEIGLAWDDRERPVLDDIREWVSEFCLNCFLASTLRLAARCTALRRSGVMRCRASAAVSLDETRRPR